MTSQPRHREIACVIVVDTRGRLLLQRRDDVPGILRPGKVALFGGHREGDESHPECAVRELYEELGCIIPPASLEHLLSHKGADLDAIGGTAHAEFFVVCGIRADEVKVTEGSLLILEAKEFPAIKDRFSPFALTAVQIFLDQDRSLRDSK